MLINGVPGDKVSIHDRGLLYGDGVFRTLRMHDGHPQHWPHHYRKLSQDCAALDLTCPAAELLLAELQQLAEQQPSCVAKIIVTRGQGVRGYAPPEHPTPTRILSLSTQPQYPQSHYTQGISMRVCDLRLAHQPRMAGVKHLNRLENVLAAAEWNDAGIAEGVLLDIEGNVIAGTRSNLFMVKNGKLFTPDLTRCGVAGVQRERVMEWAVTQGIPCQAGQFTLDELLVADEVFLVNSVIGLWPVRELSSRTWKRHPVSMRIQEWLSLESTN